MTEEAKLAVDLNKVLAEFGCSRDNYNNWLRRSVLSHQVETQRGIAREMTRDATLEVAYMEVLTRHGISIQSAKRQTDIWLKQDAEGIAPSYVSFSPDRQSVDEVPWTGDTPLDRIAVYLTDEDDVGELVRDSSEPNRSLPRKSLGFSIINRIEIVRRADLLFEASGEVAGDA